MNIVRSFAQYLEDQAVATIGQDLFISRARTEPDALFWLIPVGGVSETKNINTGYLTTHEIALYYRDNEPGTVYDQLKTIQDLVMDEDCIDLQDYIVVGIKTAGPFTDQDLDNENRTVGLLQISITTYKE